MDFSEQYIEMCRKAERVQSLKSRNEHNHVHLYFEKERMLDVWLPKQDQLQGMIEGSFEDKLKLLGMFLAPHIKGIPNVDMKEISEQFKESISGINNATLIPFVDTFEKAWLCLVMKEVYGKVWIEESGSWEIVLEKAETERKA